MSNVSRIRPKFQTLTIIDKGAKRSFSQSCPPVKAGRSHYRRRAAAHAPMVAGDFSPATMGACAVVAEACGDRKHAPHTASCGAKHNTKTPKLIK